MNERAERTNVSVNLRGGVLTWIALDGQRCTVVRIAGDVATFEYLNGETATRIIQLSNDARHAIMDLAVSLLRGNVP